MRKAITQLFERHVLIGHKEEIGDVEFSPDQSSLLTVSRDGTARTWDTQTGAPKLVFDPKSGPLYGAHFSTDGLLRRATVVGTEPGGIFKAIARSKKCDLQ